MKLTAWLLAGCVIVGLVMVGVFALIFGGIGYGYLKMNEQPTHDPNAPTPVPELNLTFLIQDQGLWEPIPETNGCFGTGIASGFQENNTGTVTFDGDPDSSQTFTLREGTDQSSRGGGCYFSIEVPRQNFDDIEIVVGDVTGACRESQFGQVSYEISAEVTVLDSELRCEDLHPLNDPVTPLASPGAESSEPVPTRIAAGSARASSRSLPRDYVVAHSSPGLPAASLSPA